jgi:hypothetical protein
MSNDCLESGPRSTQPLPLSSDVRPSS